MFFLCKVDIYMYIYIPRFDRRSRPNEFNLSREASCWMFSVFKSGTFYLPLLFLYEGTYIYANWILSVSGIRCDFGFVYNLIWLTVRYQLRAESCENVRNLDDRSKSVSPRFTFVRHDDDDNDNDDNDDIFMFSLS